MLMPPRQLSMGVSSFVQNQSDILKIETGSKLMQSKIQGRNCSFDLGSYKVLTEQTPIKKGVTFISSIKLEHLLTSDQDMKSGSCECKAKPFAISAT